MNKRLVSLDVMRGLIMIFLAAESCELYNSIHDLHPGGIAGSLLEEFYHHPWNGLRFWDLIQPSFMTMAGAALYISYFQKTEKGISWEKNFKHVAIRCLKLFICGTALHCVYKGKLVWELWNVLTQLSFTTLIAYFIIRKSSSFQIGFSIFLLILTEVLYRFVLVQGFEQPFVEGHNFGSYFDMLVMGKINPDGWVFINILPTAANTIWGAVAGRLLISHVSSSEKIKRLLIAAAVGLIFGFGLDWLHLTPIIKRIATSSFMLASGGWVFIVMAFLYWLIDVKKYQSYAWICTVVGMNSIFIYLFFGTVGSQWVNPTVAIFVKGFFGMAGVPELALAVLAALATWLFEWYICYFLYKKKVFFKL